MLYVKNSVRPRSLVIAAAVVNASIEGQLPDLTITSGNDSHHMEGSKHYTGDALDVRSKHLSEEQLASLVSIVRRRLGYGYQVIVEDRGKPGEHVHLEYDPASR